MVYCRIPIMDGDGNSHAIIEAAIRCVVTLVQRDFRTLVACSAGMSRSLVIAAAALALVTIQTPADCLRAIVTGGSHDISPPLWSTVQIVYNEIVGG